MKAIPIYNCVSCPISFGAAISEKLPEVSDLFDLIEFNLGHQELVLIA